MRIRIFLIALASILSINLNAQNDSYTNASYKNGGMVGFKRFIMKEFRYRMPPNINDVGRIVVNFVVTETGQLDSIVIWNGINDYMQKEALRVLKLTDGDWSPSIYNGKNVRTHFDLIPILTYYGNGEDIDNLFVQSLTRAKNKYQKGKVEKAIKDLDKAVNYNPLNKEVFELRAKYKKEINDVDGYENDIQRAKILEGSGVKLVKQEELFEYINNVLKDNN